MEAATLRAGAVCGLDGEQLRGTGARDARCGHGLNDGLGHSFDALGGRSLCGHDAEQFYYDDYNMDAHSGHAGATIERPGLM